MTKKIFKTIVSIIFLIILIYLAKYFLYETNFELKNSYKSSEELPGIGGFYGVIILLAFLFYIIPSIWRKTKTEKIIEKGLENELTELSEAYKLDLFTKSEYENKKDELLAKSEIKTENEKDINQIEKERINNSLIKLEELKAKKLITEKEYSEKKSLLIPKKLSIDEINELVKDCKFKDENISEYLGEEFHPKIENLNYSDLVSILENAKEYQISRVFQAYTQIKKTNANTVHN